MGKNLLEAAALKYLKTLNFSVIPVEPGGKRPNLIPWEEFKNRKPTEEEIKDWWARWPEANVGIVTGGISNLCVIDIDSEEGKAALQEILPDNLITTTVNTPRGGQHLWFTPPSPCPSNNQGRSELPGVDFRGEGGVIVAPPSRRNGRQYAFLDNLGPYVERAVLPLQYLNLISNSFKNARARESLYKENVTNVTDYFKKGKRNENLFHALTCLLKGGMKPNMAMQVLDILANNCEPPYPKEETQRIFESALLRGERHHENIMGEVREWVSVTSGDFSVTSLYHDVTFVTKQEKAACRKALQRLCTEGFIKKHPSKSGIYKRVLNERTKMDMKRADMDALDLRWPLGLEELVMMLPGNLAVIAGTSNAGKTAFLMNFMRLNMERHRIHYFNTEMGETEIKGRLCASDVSWEGWQRLMAEGQVNFYSDTADFAGRILPDDINIIDFLEIGTDFYRVGEFISEIYQVTRERKGLCFLALQKKTGAETGRGGEFSLEKPRLYLSMDYDTIKIVKAKNWKDRKTNPNKLAMRFKIGQGGWGFQPMEPEWEKEEVIKRRKL